MFLSTLFYNHVFKYVTPPNTRLTFHLTPIIYSYLFVSEIFSRHFLQPIISLWSHEGSGFCTHQSTVTLLWFNLKNSKQRKYCITLQFMLPHLFQLFLNSKCTEPCTVQGTTKGYTESNTMQFLYLKNHSFRIILMALLPLTQGIDLTWYSLISIWFPACHPLATTHLTVQQCNTLHTNINTSCLATRS